MPSADESDGLKDAIFRFSHEKAPVFELSKELTLSLGNRKARTDLTLLLTTECSPWADGKSRAGLHIIDKGDEASPVRA